MNHCIFITSNLPSVLYLPFLSIHNIQSFICLCSFTWLSNL